MFCRDIIGVFSIDLIYYLIYKIEQDRLILILIIGKDSSVLSMACKF